MKKALRTLCAALVLTVCLCLPAFAQEAKPAEPSAKEDKTVTDLTGRETAFIQQKVFSMMPRFFVYMDGVERAEIVKRLTFFYEKYEIEGLDWTIEGDFWAHEYRITQNGREVVSISKEWFTWGDCYALDIADSADEMLALAVVLAIDAVHAQANAAAAST